MWLMLLWAESRCGAPLHKSIS